MSTIDELSERFRKLRDRSRAQLIEVSAAMKAHESAHPFGAPPGSEFRMVLSEFQKTNTELAALENEMLEAIGLTEEQLEAMEALDLPGQDDNWWLSQILDVAPSDHFDDFAPAAVAGLMARVDNHWLMTEAKHAYRLDRQFLNDPLQIVSGTRIPWSAPASAPQRYAHMLLVAQDHLDKRDDLDFFSAAEFLPDLAVLGSRLDVVPRLGAEAMRKLDRLPLTTDEEVRSTVYELIVGTAYALKGRQIEMLPASKVGKTPDFRIHDFSAPAVVECKRRPGPAEFELSEAAVIRTLFERLHPFIVDRSLHGCLQLSFSKELSTLDLQEVREVIARQLSQSDDLQTTTVEWGTVGYVRLPLTGRTATTRLYSPDFLETVFGWSSMNNEWDGAIFRVEPPSTVRVATFSSPFCLQWRSESAEAIARRSRDVTSLVAKAAKQIPAGELGFIYVAYPEGQRGRIADYRTQRIIEANADCAHRWTIRIPMMVISRLYYRALGVGVPDLIESALPAVADGDKYWLTQLPGRVMGLRRL